MEFISPDPDKTRYDHFCLSVWQDKNDILIFDLILLIFFWGRLTVSGFVFHNGEIHSIENYEIPSVRFVLFFLFKIYAHRVGQK